MKESQIVAPQNFNERDIHSCRDKNRGGPSSETEILLHVNLYRINQCTGSSRPPSTLFRHNAPRLCIYACYMNNE